MARRVFGQIYKERSGSWRARYTGPDGNRYTAPTTSKTLEPLDRWLSDQRKLIASGEWAPPQVEAERKAVQVARLAAQDRTLGEYAPHWIATRTNAQGLPLAVRTAAEYRRLLAGPLADLAGLKLTAITEAIVRTWRAKQMNRGTVTQTARAYALLGSIMRTAVADKIITENPCTIKGGAKSRTGIPVLPPTDDEYEAVLAALPVNYRALAVIAASSGLRFGEVTALLKPDVQVERADTGTVVRIAVTKGVVFVKGGRQVKGPKSLAGVRTVPVYGREAEVIAEYMDTLTDADVLLFHAATDPTKHLPHGTWLDAWHEAREAAGRPDLRLHALRHYAGTRYAQAGATIKETMDRLGQSTTEAAMRYQHSGNRDDELARRMAR